MGSFFFQNKYPHPPLQIYCVQIIPQNLNLCINMREGTREREEVGGKRGVGKESVCVQVYRLSQWIYIFKEFSVFLCFPNICIYVSTPSFLLFVVFFHCSSTQCPHVIRCSLKRGFVGCELQLAHLYSALSVLAPALHSAPAFSVLLTSVVLFKKKKLDGF